jgi:hypothetical protein
MPPSGPFAGSQIPARSRFGAGPGFSPFLSKSYTAPGNRFWAFCWPRIAGAKQSSVVIAAAPSPIVPRIVLLLLNVSSKFNRRHSERSEESLCGFASSFGR